MDRFEIDRLTDEVARRVKARLGTEAAGAAQCLEHLGVRRLSDRIIVPIGVSARHMHITREVMESLFGRGHELGVLRTLTQAGEFAARETATIVGASGRALENVRILGPVRSFTQAELARSDGVRLRLDLPIRRTGELAGSPGITVVGPAGTVALREGAIRATRHIHMSEQDATRFGLRDGQVVRARVGGERGVTFENVLVRVGQGFVLDFHIDTDDANAAGVDTGCLAEVIP